MQVQRCRFSKRNWRNSDVIITMLPASHHVKQVVLGENGILETAKEGTVIIDMSSISPVVSKGNCS